LVGAKGGFAGCHAVDVVHFGAAVQWIFQFAHVCSIAGRRFHSLQPSIMVPLDSACLEPV
jgi:hypothetical protein